MNLTGRATRRTLLRAVTAATAAGATTAACSAEDRPIQVAVVWSAEELRLFREVLRGYERELGRNVQVTSAGDDIDAFLRARHLAGTSPDVAILPRPGLVGEYARRGWLAILDEPEPRTTSAPTPPPDNLHERLRYDDRLYGVWVKIAHKSLFWYLPSPNFQPPDDWPTLVDLTRELGQQASGTDQPAPLAIGAADGWVLTDWFENVLADVASREVYEALARDGADWEGAEVREALDRLAELWSLKGAFPGGGRRALLTQYEESVIQVLATRQAVMVFEGDFVEGVAETFGRGREFARFPFPKGPRSNTNPLVVGGDAAVVFKGSRYGTELVRWLTNAEAFKPWLEAGGYLSPNLDVTPDPHRDELRDQLATQISEAADAGNLRFDLSDQLPGSFTGSDGVGSWRIMQDFFADVTSGRVTGAVQRTADEFARADRAARSGR
jgi:ABC-type glycerol-3-phosphate transport system substrate-binding protein